MTPPGTPGTPEDDYREQIRRCARALSTAHNELVEADVAGENRLAALRLFTDGNLDKRTRKLRDQLDLVPDLLEDFDDLLGSYVRSVPLAAYDGGSTDGDRFLDWLASHRRLTPEQLDVVACQRGRNAVERIAAGNRLAHVRFQELLSRAGELVAELDTNPGLWLHLNPIRSRQTFHTHVLLDEDDPLPATLLFFPVGNDIRTALLEPEGLAVIDALAASTPARVDDLSGPGRTGLGRSELVEVCRDLAAPGLLAFG